MLEWGEKNVKVRLCLMKTGIAVNFVQSGIAVKQSVMFPKKS